MIDSADGSFAVEGHRVLADRREGESPPVPTPVEPTVRDDVDAAFDHVDRVGLLGRGRADGSANRPIAEGWSRAQSADGEPVVVIHANDADPDATVDEYLCRTAARRVLDAAGAVASVVGATDVVAFVSEDDAHTATQLAEASTSDERIAVGPEKFLVGEPTMALEALEGNDRIEARRRPPGPDEWGLYGRPTLVHTPRTLLQLAELWRNPAAFDADAADPGTRLFTVTGDVPEPATVELSTGTPLARLLDAVDEPTGARYCVGGRFGGLTRTLDVPASAPALEAAGLGAEGIVEVLGPKRCVVATVGQRAAVAREENCGRCVPCREGSIQAHERLRAVYRGTFDASELRELGRVMASTSLCAFGETAARPLLTGLEAFESEFRAHADGRCPAGSCEGLR